MLQRIITRNIHRGLLLRSEEKTSLIKNLLDDAVTGVDVNPTNPDDNWATQPYAEGTVFKRDQSKKAERPNIDPRETTIILFPGQGSQYVGMAKNLIKFPGAKDMFDIANEVLGYDLLKLCLEGPKEKLDKTMYSQPAILVTSLAALEKLKEERPNAIDNCVATAGFSLGEITSLIFAGSIPFDKGVKLVQIRGEAMQMASELNESGMATILYGPDSQLNLACQKAKLWCIERGIENPECKIVNYLYPHCKVIAGNNEALKFIEINQKQYKLRRIKRLPVSGAFHTDLMLPACDVFKRALKKITIEDPIISVHSNVDGKCYKNVNHIINQLPKQIIKPVKWEQTLHILYERSQGEYFPRTFECGPGKSLTTILKQVNSKAWDTSINIEA